MLELLEDVTSAPISALSGPSPTLVPKPRMNWTLFIRTPRRSSLRSVYCPFMRGGTKFETTWSSPLQEIVWSSGAAWFISVQDTEASASLAGMREEESESVSVPVTLSLNLSELVVDGARSGTTACTNACIRSYSSGDNTHGMLVTIPELVGADGTPKFVPVKNLNVSPLKVRDTSPNRSSASEKKRDDCRKDRLNVSVTPPESFVIPNERSPPSIAPGNRSASMTLVCSLTGTDIERP